MDSKLSKWMESELSDLGVIKLNPKKYSDKYNPVTLKVWKPEFKGEEPPF